MRITKYQKNKGFTVLEGLTVVLIITILVLIVMPNFINNKERATESQILGNIRTLRIMLETYKVDNKIYPENLQTLGIEASNKGYNKILKNPYTNANGSVESGKWAINYVEPPAPAPGFVGYQPFDENNSYYLFGYDRNGQFIKREGKVYTITNG
jgi:competence protein ComGC